MTSLHAYSRRLLRREARRPHLADALLSSGATRYATYRLRYMVVRMVLRAWFHLVELSILWPLLAHGLLAPIFLVRMSTFVVAGFWWGGLEEMREQVRTSASHGQWFRVRRIIDGWLCLGSTGQMLLLGLSAGIIWINRQSDTLSAMDLEAYLLACVFRLCIDMLGRTYHSGVFALRRIHRPLWSLLLTDFLDGALVLVLWSMGCRFWSLSISMLTVGILKGGLLFFFVARAYRDSPIPRLMKRRLFRGLAYITPAHMGRFVVHGVANLGGHVDTIVIITLVASGTSATAQLPLAMVMYLLRPFIGGSYTWGRLFYFDFKQIQHRYGAFLHARFLAFIKRITLGFAALTATLCLVWIALVVPWFMGMPPHAPVRAEILKTTMLLLPFVCIRSWFGMYHIQAFSYGMYRQLLWMTASTVLGVGFIGITIPAPLPRLGAITGLLLLVVLLFRRSGTPSPRRDGDDTPGVISLPHFVNRLSAVNTDVQGGHVDVNRKIVPRDRIMDQLVATYPGLWASRVGRSGLLWFLPHGRIPRSEVVMTCGGAATAVTVFFSPDGGTAADRMYPHMANITPRNGVPAQSVDALDAAFAAAFPTGQVVTPTKGRIGVAVSTQSRQAMQRTLGIITRARTVSNRHRFDVGDWDMAVFCPAGIPQRLFLMPKTAPMSHRVDFCALVFQTTLWHSRTTPPLHDAT